MTVAKAICLVATVVGILIISFPALFPMSGTISSIISAASAVLVAVGSYFFAYLGQGEKIEKMEKKHQHNIEVLQSQIADTGLDFFIKQYAEDLVEVRLIQDTLNDILKYTQEEPINGEAIKQALLGIRRLHFKGFLSKAGELLHAGGHVELLNRFLGHLESILHSHREIPDSLREEIQQLREIRETGKKRLA
ncbi:MAG: hypothetical protein ONB13_08285 [candidate division KSB1 bacterium]|nr:hypothetical protein [candidate division KSB1 bacterium]MDZ7333966.1 hypothetical protein [candidate division KSB1 bacterium]MDZ7356762.1 hypothetical protein [candidate division KSB1 bacterium]MDZ7376605.1 hypothetical protein [candidate division KSB1 bacterium]MDZ7399951.1 hypothetical protein [candidate division KSB1 bacterium]